MGESIEEKQKRLESIFGDTNKYINGEINFPIETDEIEGYFVERLTDWADFAEVWARIEENEQQKQWEGSIFPAIVDFSKEWLINTRSYISSNCVKNSKYNERMSKYVAMIDQLINVGSYCDCISIHPEIRFLSVVSTLGGLVQHCFAAKEIPFYLTPAIIQTIRGDLLLLAAEINKTMFHKIFPYYKKGLEVEKNQVENSRLSQKGKIFTSAVDDLLKQTVRDIREDNLIKGGNWIAGFVAKKIKEETGCDYQANSIRQRPWFKNEGWKTI